MEDSLRKVDLSLIVEDGSLGREVQPLRQEEKTGWKRREQTV